MDLTNDLKLLKKKEQQKKAMKKYAETHKEIMRKNSANYYNKNKDDPDFKKHCSEKSLRTYYKKKNRIINDTNENI